MKRLVTFITLPLLAALAAVSLVRAVDRLIELGKRFDYFVYPNRDHGLREGKGSEAHVRMLIARYLVEHLPARAR